MNTVRSVFVSDIHLGTRACQAERLVDFLRAYQAEYLYLVGDIVDFWAMNRSIYWSEAQNTVVQKVLRRARGGEHVMLIPGNHDEALRDYVGTEFGNIRIEAEWVHTTADGRRFLLVHGDAYDQVTRHHRWVAMLGDVAYNVLVRMNVMLSWLRRHIGRPGYWSLAGYAKRRVKRALEFIYDYESSVIHAVRERELDGVICGHIHCAANREVDGLMYVNCGDWVDSCTAIVEHLDGRLELVDWGAGAAAADAIQTAGAAPRALSPGSGCDESHAPECPPGVVFPALVAAARTQPDASRSGGSGVSWPGHGPGRGLARAQALRQQVEPPCGVGTAQPNDSGAGCAPR